MTRIQNFGERKPVLSAPDATLARSDLHEQGFAAGEVILDGPQGPEQARPNRERPEKPLGHPGAKGRVDFRNCDDGPRNDDQNSGKELIALRIVNFWRPVAAAPFPAPAP